VQFTPRNHVRQASLDYPPRGLHLPLNLESRLGRLRHRRRLSLLKQVLAVVGPLLLGIAIVLLLAGFGVIAATR